MRAAGDPAPLTGQAFALLLLSLIAALGLALLGSLTLGRYPLSGAQVLHAVLTIREGATHPASDVPWVVVNVIRLPRILEVVLSGMSLALAGAALQGLFRNPLVGPEIIGVSSGASFGGALAIALGGTGWLMVTAASAFGLTALIAVLTLAALTRRSGTLGLILSGTIVSAFFGAAVGLLEYVAEARSQLPALTYWLLGSFAGANFTKVSLLAGSLIIAGSPLWGLRWRLNVLSLDESDARTLGLHPGRLRWGIIALSAILVGTQVAVSGGVAFVGLIVPHFARFLVGAEHTRLLPVSCLLGAIYLLVLDDLARSVAEQLPIGLLTAFVGAPIFAVLFWRFQGRGWASD